MGVLKFDEITFVRSNWRFLRMFDEGLGGIRKVGLDVASKCQIYFEKNLKLRST